MDSAIIEGVVNAVVFANPENGYTVLRLETGDGLVTVTGSIPGVSAGERLLLTGGWLTHPQYGQQYKADTFEIKPPSTEDEIFRYLASGAIKYIGPAKARDIVDKFGRRALEVIESEPLSLSKVKGISRGIAIKIGEEYSRQVGLRRLIAFFNTYAVKPHIAMRVYKQYGDDAIGTVRENPYIITGEAYGAEFFEADAIALDLGFDSGCPERISAALIFELQHNTGNGHTFIPRDKLIAATDELIGAGNEPIADALDVLCECGDVVTEAVAGVHGCYLRHMYEAECYSAQRISAMTSHTYPQKDLDAVIREIECEHGIDYADMQHESLKLAAKCGIMALTGGPGTGKTTTVRGILMLFDALGLDAALCAPTGRAAKRLSETCQREAATIHRMLGAKPGDDGELYFSHDEDNPLKADVVIVDESSMIDILLMHSLLYALKPGCRLIMVGDADQLPSVGPGNVFADIIRSGAVPTVALTEIFRQAQGSGIVRCAHSVNKGVVPDMTQNYPDLFFMRRQSEEQIAETVTELYGRRLPDNMGMDPSQIQVLSPTRKRAAGTMRLNEQLRNAANPGHAGKKEKQFGEYLFRAGDKVMQIRNNYDIMWESPDGNAEGMGVFNGDIGIIKELDLVKETITVDFDDKTVTYLFDQLPELEPAFAMTVHKSQGSEYPAVILAMTAAAPLLQTRNVLYTAMTRAKSLLVIVGNPEVMAKMVINDKRQKRYSGLRARLMINN